MNIKTPSAEYLSQEQNWKTVRCLSKGEKALKDADKEHFGTFLVQPCSYDKSQENKNRYLEYVERAALFNFTKRTLAGMVGMVCSKPTKIDINKKIEYLINDADGAGLGLQQLANEMLIDVLETGNEGILVDYPQVHDVTTEYDADVRGIRAQIQIYKPETILDYRDQSIGTSKVLTYVKLKEVVSEVDEHDFFKTETENYYRVLMLNEDGNYEQRLYNDKDELESEPIIPKNSKGLPFKYIPFHFCGAVNNRPGFDVSPVLEIADLNIKHYRNSAEWEDSCFMVGQPTVVLAGLTSQWAADNFTDGQVRLGSRSNPIPLPVGGSATLLQPSPNIMSSDGMKHKEEQALALGARLITPGSGAETAEAAYIKHSTDASVLKIVVNNINDTIKAAFRDVVEFMGVEDNSTFELNTDFIADRMDAQQIQALVASWQAGVIDKDILQGKFVKSGIIPQGTDLEKMNQNIADNPQGINLGTM